MPMQVPQIPRIGSSSIRYIYIATTELEPQLLIASIYDSHLLVTLVKKIRKSIYRH